MAGLTSPVAPVVLVSGTVLAIGKDRPVTKIRHRYAHIWVRWLNEVLPPNVKKGATVAVVGKLMTFNNGTAFQLYDTVLLRVKPKDIVAAFRRILPDAIVDPAEYMNVEQNPDQVRIGEG